MSTLVTSQEPKFEFEFLDGLQAIRNSLTANILKKIITGFYTFNTDERDYLLGYIPVDAMENGSNENASDIEDQTPESEDQTPESEDQTPESEDQTPESEAQTPEIEDQTPDEKGFFCSSHAPLLPEVSFSSCLRNLFKKHFRLKP